MSRFYISDGARPGRRSPSAEYATKVPGVGSDVLNEAQAIARGRKLTPTLGEAFLLTPTNLSVVTANVIWGNQYGNPFEAFRVFDGNTSSTWFSYDAANTWVGYDFGVGVQKTVSKYKIHGNGSHFNGAYWLLESSNNGTDWTLVDTSPPFYNGWNERTGYGTPAPARYWRVRSIDGSSVSIANREVGSLEFWGN